MSLFASASTSFLTPTLLVASGGAVGAALRYWVGQLLHGLTPPGGFPWALLTINTLGSLVMGVLFGWLFAQDGGTEGQRLFLAVGILGGFTTFSAFSLEIILMIQRGAIGAALGFIVASVLAGVAALYLGLIVMGPAK